MTSRRATSISHSNRIAAIKFRDRATVSPTISMTGHDLRLGFLHALLLAIGRCYLMMWLWNNEMIIELTLVGSAWILET
jgi:hypothetical protein